VPTITCPSAEDLMAFHLGTLSEAELDAVGDHLEVCSDCHNRMQTLDGVTDSVLSLLGGAATAESAGPTEHGTPCASPGEEKGLDFLSPARSPEEIGWLGQHYRVRRLLGRGGMGIVFAAEDTRLGRMVALKVLKPGLAAEPDARQRFLREARAMAALPGNPHLVPIYDVGEVNGLPFLAMELLQGAPLDERLANGPPLTIAEIIHFGRGIASGLGAAHEHGLIHRDIKPANIWLEARSEGRGTREATSGSSLDPRLSSLAPRPSSLAPRVKILDFGLARPAEENVKLTRSGVIAGTPAYLSPEQAQDQPLDARTDLFSLGCVLYELCAGKPPFRGRTAFALLNAITTSVPAPLRTVRPELPPALADLIMKLMAKRPADRPRSAQLVVERLDALAESPPARPPARQPSRRGLVALLTAVAATILIAAAVLHVRTSKGLVEIRTDDPKIRVTVEQDGELITILDPVSKQQVELRAGEYQVKLLPEGTGLQLSTDHFTLRRGGKEVLTVRRLDDMPKGADAAWLRQVAALEANEQVKAVIERLRKLNPEFKTDVRHKIEDGVVRELVFSADNIHDISPVRALTGLRVLTCESENKNTGRLTDLNPLKGLKLTRLDCNNTGVADLSPLAGMPLTYLRCGYCPLKDLSPLRAAPLETLVCDSTRVSDLTPLTGRPLLWLNCAKTPIADLTPLRGLKLNTLLCDYTLVQDLAPLAGMPLTRLNCGVTQVSNLAPLKGLSLKLLGIGQTPVKDLSPLKGMKLEVLWANHTAVADLSPLQGMPLNTMWCGVSKVRDLSALAGMPLNDVSFDLHADTDLKVLRAIASLQTINGQPAAEFWRKHGK
jgi:eukaryotic-like serine/threonine-protein kinase